MSKRRELMDTEFRLELVEQKLRRITNEYQLLIAKRDRLKAELGDDQPPLTGWDVT